MLKVFYFLYYAAVGTSLGYLAPWMRGLGFTGEEVGAISMAQQLVGVPAALAWGTFADRLGSPARTLRLCGGGAVLCACWLPFMRTPLSVGAVLVAFSLFAGAVVPLVDSVTVAATQRAGTSYARTRLWGSIGFIVTAQGLGAALSLRGERPGDLLVPISYAACIAGWALAGQRVPDEAPPADRPHLRDALRLLRDPRLLFVLAICALHWGALSPYHLLFGVLVHDRGLPSHVTGLAMATGVFAEVLALLAFPALEKRLSLRVLFAAAFAGSIVRWLLVSAAVSAPSLVLLQLFHALGFGIFWGAAVEAMTRIVPPRHRATGQALFSAVVFAGGNGVGYALSGYGYDRLGNGAALFPYSALTDAAALLLLMLPLTPSRGRA